MVIYLYSGPELQRNRLRRRQHLRCWKPDAGVMRERTIFHHGKPVNDTSVIDNESLRRTKNCCQRRPDECRRFGS